jgi:hypothetical protein
MVVTVASLPLIYGIRAGTVTPSHAARPRPVTP